MARRFVGVAGGLLIAVLFGCSGQVTAATPTPGPASGSTGVQGVIPADPPSVAASVISPANGGTTSNALTNVSGACGNGLLVKVFTNEIFIGSAICQRGTYSIQVGLFNGRNEIVSRVYDALDQAGPDSNRVTITFNDGRFEAFGTHVSLTSQFARRGAQPGQTLTWPVTVSGGVAPYAMTVDWGDGSAPQLYSVATPGETGLSHTYKAAGTYNVFIRIADKNQTESFLQVVAVISGSVSGREPTATGSGTTSTGTIVPIDRSVLIGAIGVIIVLVPAGFWLGRRYELAYLRQQIEREVQA